MEKIASILGKEEDPHRYKILADEARDAFINRFVKADGTIRGGTQTSYILALHFDLLPEKLRPRAAAELVRNIQAREDHLGTGFVGTPYINRVLSDMGQLDTAYALLKKTTWPSWLYSVTQRVTTIWERWDGWTHEKGFQDPGMNSFNHYAYGAVSAWTYLAIGGIDVDRDRPGYKHIIMRPQPGGGSTHARFEWHITIPPNATATVYIPAGNPSHVTENWTPAEQARGVKLLRVENGSVVFELQSGSYDFLTAKQ